MKPLDILEAVLGGIDWIARVISGGCLLAVIIVLFVNSFGRYFFNISFVGGEELARIMTIWMTFMGAYLVARINRHVTIDIVLRLASEVTYRRLIFIVSLISALTTAYVATLGFDLAWRVHTAGQMSAVLPIRRAWFYYPVPLGFALMAVAFLMTAVRAATGALARPSDLSVALEDVPEAESKAGARP